LGVVGLVGFLFFFGVGVLGGLGCGRGGGGLVVVWVFLEGGGFCWFRFLFGGVGGVCLRGLLWVGWFGLGFWFWFFLVLVGLGGVSWLGLWVWVFFWCFLVICGGGVVFVLVGFGVGCLVAGWGVWGLVLVFVVWGCGVWLGFFVLALYWVVLGGFLVRLVFFSVVLVGFGCGLRWCCFGLLLMGWL